MKHILAPNPKKRTLILLVSLVYILLSGCKTNSSHPTHGQMTEFEARELAKVTCTKENELLGEGYYDAIERIWWFDLIQSHTEPGCSPVCFFFEDTQATKIESRCTGNVQAETSTPKKDLEDQREKASLKKLWSDEGYVYYDGTVTLSGDYTINNPNTSNSGEVVFFTPDDASAHLIPRQKGDERTPFFMFENQEEAQAVFKVIDETIFANKSTTCVKGKATVVISNYKTERIMTLQEDGIRYESGVPDKAKLENVISKEPYAPC